MEAKDSEKLMSKDWQHDIHDLHVALGGVAGHIELRPTIPPVEVYMLCYELIQEEGSETLQALREEDLVKLADGIVDTIVVLLGTAVSYGIDIRPIWDEIHRTNMLKSTGPIRESDGKRLKPENWEHPKVRELLLEQQNAK